MIKAVSAAASAANRSYMEDYFPDVQAKLDAAAEAKAAGTGAAGGTTPSPVPKAAAKPNLPKLAANYKPVSFGGSGGKKGRSAGAGRKTRASGGGASGASQIESALQKIQDIREEIQKLNGETAGNSLDKKLREIAQAGEKAKLPLKEIAGLQSAYTKAFQDNVVRDFNKALLELTGTEEEIRAAKMEETIEEWRKKFTEAKLSVEENHCGIQDFRSFPGIHCATVRSQKTRITCDKDAGLISCTGCDI